MFTALNISVAEKPGLYSKILSQNKQNKKEGTLPSPEPKWCCRLPANHKENHLLSQGRDLEPPPQPRDQTVIIVAETPDAVSSVVQYDAQDTAYDKFWAKCFN